MRRRHAITLSLAAALVAATLLPGGVAEAHGTMSDPASRVYTCKNEGPENPTSAACKAAVAAGGTQAFYDWNEVSLIDAGGRHRELIPDGKLCSAGREKYRGLDLARDDWPAKQISAGNLTVTYHATAPHAGSNFEFYITRDGWNPTMPLKWSDLVLLKTFTNVNPTTFTSWTLPIPPRTGRALIYSIWQRVQYSNEAFYTCSDVDFGGGGPSPSPSPSPTASPKPTPTPTPSASPSPSPTASPTAQPGGTWKAGTAYKTGDRVTYNGVSYTCRQPHTAIVGWEPPNVPALWLAV
ncbi:hypothetical protein Lfu02_10190 [Longispora fulva]|uniref:Chitin-binding protein n=1 Tax=Longispora fulva TaxID=619741 RepID=A0A8J7GNW1_9ACTN|nr:lytic polysaccharide monooxygenase [Longispora fulva]MBG6135118.1 chitin-binding protein [Longispora fulva]GIG56647.1 hypothetical protein Lfu02_10190 [Longispora fulva]